MTMYGNAAAIIRYLLWRVNFLLHWCASLLQLGQAGATERRHQELYSAGLAGVARCGEIVCISSPPMRGCQTEEQYTSLTCQRRNVWPRKAMAFSWCILISIPSM